MSFELVFIGSVFAFFIWLMLFASLDFEVQKVTDYFMNHPTRLEILIQILFTAFPIGIGSLTLQRANEPIPNEIIGILIMAAIIWPFLMNEMHNNLNERAVTLGISSKKVRVVDPIRVARASILGWIVSILLIFLALRITQFESLRFLILPLVGLGFLGVISFPLLKSISTLKQKDGSVKEKVGNQEISD